MAVCEVSLIHPNALPGLRSAAPFDCVGRLSRGIGRVHAAVISDGVKATAGQFADGERH